MTNAAFSWGALFFGFIVLGALILFGAWLFVLLSHKSATTKIILTLVMLGCLFLTMLVVPVATYHARSIERGATLEMRPRVFRQTSLDDPVFQSAEVSLEQTTHDSTWSPFVEDALDAYNYASPRSAARGLAHEIAERFSEVMEDRNQLKRIHISGSRFQGLDGDMFLADIAEIMREQFGETAAKVVVNGVGSVHSRQLPDGEVAIHVDCPGMSVQPLSWDRGRPERSGTVRATLKSKDRSITADVQMIDKPWVERFDAFVSSRPNMNYFLGRSPDFASDQNQAHQQAITNAAKAMTDRVMASALRSRRSSALSDHHIRPRVISELNHGKYIVDRFSQRFPEHGGDLWREAILVEFKPQDIQQMAREVAYKAANVRERHRSSFASLVGLFFVICVGYVFLNVATKGYYHGWIVAGCIVFFVLLGGFMLILTLA